jgi:hypothetical protein
MGSLQLRLLQRLPAGYFVTLWMSSGVATAGAKRQKLFYSASLLFHTTDTNEDEPQYAACEDNRGRGSKTKEPNYRGGCVGNCCYGAEE